MYKYIYINTYIYNCIYIIHIYISIDYIYTYIYTYTSLTTAINFYEQLRIFQYKFLHNILHLNNKLYQSGIS